MMMQWGRSFGAQRGAEVQLGATGPCSAPTKRDARPNCCESLSRVEANVPISVLVHLYRGGSIEGVRLSERRSLGLITTEIGRASVFRAVGLNSLELRLHASPGRGVRWS